MQLRNITRSIPGKLKTIKVNGKRILLKSGKEGPEALFANSDKSISISLNGK